MNLALGTEKVTINATINAGLLFFPDDALEFGQTWIIQKMTDKDDAGNTEGVYFYIRKRKPEDPHGAMIIEE